MCGLYDNEIISKKAMVVHCKIEKYKKSLNIFEICWDDLKHLVLKMGVSTMDYELITIIKILKLTNKGSYEKHHLNFKILEMHFITLISFDSGCALSRSRQALYMPLFPKLNINCPIFHACKMNNPL